MKKVLYAVLGICLFALAGCTNTKDVVSKSEKAADTIKSGQSYITLKTDSTTGTQQTIDGATFTTNPLTVSLNQSSQNQKPSKFYIGDGTVYMNLANKWYKHNVKSNSLFIKNTKAQVTAGSAVLLLKELKNNLKLKKNDKTYTLSYSGQDKTATNAANKAIAAESKSTDGIKTSSLSFSYTVNKKTYLPTKSLIEIKYTDKNGAALTSTTSGSYQSINKIKNVDIPQNVKSSAKPLPSALAKTLFK